MPSGKVRVALPQALVAPTPGFQPFQLPDEIGEWASRTLIGCPSFRRKLK